MRRNLTFSTVVLIAMAAFLGPALAVGPLLPDPAQHAAFQKQELERRQRWMHLEKAAEAKRSRLQDRYDVTYYRLAIDLRNVTGQRIKGDVTLDLRAVQAPLDTLYFDLSANMTADSVIVNGEKMRFARPGDAVLVRSPTVLEAGEIAQVRIFYQGRPAQSGFGAFTWSTHAGKPLIWTLSEPEGSREWWPCKDRPDDKADSLDVFVRTPTGLVATSNGLLTETSNHQDGSKTFHWKHRYPITTYLVSVTAGDFDRIEDHYVDAEGDSMLVEHFVYPETKSMAEIDFSITPAAIDVFSQRFGPYPFMDEKYGHTLFPWGGGMEHQTNTSYGGSLITGLHTWDWVLVHELGHQWWGDMTSPADWRDIWLNEGFATYSEALWAEHVYGLSGYHRYMTEGTVVHDPSGPLYDPILLFDGNTVYNKGGWAVHMLRGVLGDSLFFASLTEYRNRTAYRSTTTAEFQSIVEEVANRPMDWFFQPWVYGTDRPHYAVSFLRLGEPGLPSVAVHVEQTQDEPEFFEMPLDVQIDLEGGGLVRKRIWNDRDHADLELELPAAASGVTLDPDDWILDAVETVPYTMHITMADLPPGHAGNPYNVVVTGRGGEPPYAWTAVDPLPPSIALDEETGLLSGTAPDSGSYAFTLRLRDGHGLEDLQAYRWVVATEPPDTSTTPVSDLFGLDMRPNPARSWVGFMIGGPVDDQFVLAVYDVQGRRVKTVWDGPRPPREISWNGTDDSGNTVASGVYVARLTSRSGEVKRRLVFVH
jgi:aminopeptidase N